MAIKNYRVRTRLPTAYNTAIGRSITRFSVIEARLRKFVYALLEVSPAFGRIAVRSPRVEDALNMIQDLMALRGFTTDVEFKGERGLITACKKLEKFRDMIAHGVWTHHEGSKDPIFQATAGTYQGESGQSAKARIAPQALKITLADFRGNANATSEVLTVVDFLGKEIRRQHEASLKIRAQQSAKDQLRRNPPTRQNPAKRQLRQKS